MNTSMSRNLFGAAVAASLLCGAANVNAAIQTLVSEDFEGATGPFPANVTGSNTVFSPGANTNNGSGNTAQVLDSGSPFGTGNYMHLFAPSGSSGHALVAHDFGQTVVDPFEIIFDFYDLAPQNTGDDTSYDFQVAAGTNIVNNADKLFQVALKEGILEPSSNNTARSTYTVGEVYNLRFVVNQTEDAIVYDGNVSLGAERLHVYVNGSLVTFLDADSNPIQDMAFRNPGTAVTEFGVRAASNGAQVSAYIDNVLVRTIPEPASLALLGLGSLMMIRRRQA